MRILMVSTEYPPMIGGVGRYTANLTKALRDYGFDVQVACNEKGDGEHTGISPRNKDNSELLLKIVNQVKPDIVHIQFEPGLYGLILDPKNPKRSGTYIDSFYKICPVPIVTTFHTAYNFRQWMSHANIIKTTGKTGIFGIPARALVRTWKYFLNYRAFTELNREKLRMSKAGICFSQYLADSIGGGHVIYHGSESVISPTPEKREARVRFSLPQNRRIALVVGFMTVTKGWSIIRDMDIPDNWLVVVNSSKSHYNIENNHFSIGGNNIVDLKRGFLTECELSLLFHASDAVLLPYRVTAASGVMFDALGHGLPFIATNLGFFKEFAAKGMGLAVKRNSESFSGGLRVLDRDYEKYSAAVKSFQGKLKWEYIANQHASVYRMISGRITTNK